MKDRYMIHVGDCLESLRSMDDNSIHCCVTSPPYFGLRDYGMDGQIGLEDSPEEYIDRLVAIFREVWRVLRDDGTLWVNIGDSYAGSWGGAAGKTTLASVSKNNITNKPRLPSRKSILNSGLKQKDLIGIPWMLAFALRSDGWYLRQEIIWAKPNPMPESVRDRCTKSHEQIFLLSKSPRYYCDMASIEEPAKWERWGDQTELKSHTGTAGHLGGKLKSDLPIRDKKNRRSVWNVPTKPYGGAHFAVFPPSLIEPCILAGCPREGVVLDMFGGSGTTAGVALALGRRAVLCELNPSYAALVPDRISSVLEGYGRSGCLNQEVLFG